MLKAVAGLQEEIVKLTQDIIKIQSYTGEEGEMADFVLRKLQEFEVDEAFIDSDLVYGDFAPAIRYRMCHQVVSL